MNFLYLLPLAVFTIWLIIGTFLGTHSRNYDNRDFFRAFLFIEVFVLSLIGLILFLSHL